MLLLTVWIKKMFVPLACGILFVALTVTLTTNPVWLLDVLARAATKQTERLGLAGTAAQAITGVKPPAASVESDVDRPNQCKVFDIVDGDTFTCDFNRDGKIDRKTEKVRMLYIDTPELHHSKRNPSGLPQPFSQEAMAFSKARLQGKQVYLRYDKNPQDRYGRKLALVYTTHPDKTPSISVNEQLLKAGLATTMMIKPNLRFEKQMLQLEQQAQLSQLGLWQQSVQP
jgi:endonuclease YncB( thermonuclease family)